MNLFILLSLIVIVDWCFVFLFDFKLDVFENRYYNYIVLLCYIVIGDYIRT